MLCRYFQQGYCKFGDNCRYVHDDYEQNDVYHNDHNYRQTRNIQTHNYGYKRGEGDSYQQRQYQHSGNSNRGRYDAHGYLEDNRFAALENQREQKREITAEDILTNIQLEFMDWESSGMWQLSSYGILKYTKSVAGFEEYSFEEIRFASLVAMRNGHTENHVSWLQESLRRNANHRKQFLHSSDAQRNCILQLIKTLMSDDDKKSETSQNFSKSGFGTGVMSQNPAPGNLLVFGAINQSIPPKQSQQQNVFQSQQQNVFQSQQQNVFQQQNPFQQVIQSDQQAVPSVSAHFSPANILPQAQQTTGIFQTQQTTGIFQTQQHSTVTTQPTGDGTMAGAYGSPDGQSKADLEQFQLDFFTRIPLNPPPKEFT